MNAYENLVGNSRIPIEKLLSEEEIKKVENYIEEKPERERQKEQEEAKKIEYMEREIRKEQEEARKPKARLKIGGGIAINSQEDIQDFLGITPQLANKKGKGFAMGLDMVVMNSETNSEDSYRTEDKEPVVGCRQGHINT